MSDPDCGAEHCITCSDEAEAMTVLRIDTGRSLALCRAEDSGAHMTVEIGLVGPVHPGDRLLVHAGTAIVRLEPVESVESVT